VIGIGFGPARVNAAYDFFPIPSENSCFEDGGAQERNEAAQEFVKPEFFRRNACSSVASQFTNLRCIDFRFHLN